MSMVGTLLTSAIEFLTGIVNIWSLKIAHAQVHDMVIMGVQRQKRWLEGVYIVRSRAMNTTEIFVFCRPNSHIQIQWQHILHRSSFEDFFFRLFLFFGVGRLRRVRSRNSSNEASNTLRRLQGHVRVFVHARRANEKPRRKVNLPFR